MNTKHNTQVLEKYLAIAADSVASLRQVDVERVLQSIESGNVDGVTRSDIATFILTQRPDLAAEVTELMTELFAAENWTPDKHVALLETQFSRNELEELGFTFTSFTQGGWGYSFSNNAYCNGVGLSDGSSDRPCKFMTEDSVVHAANEVWRRIRQSMPMSSTMEANARNVVKIGNDEKRKAIEAAGYTIRSQNVGTPMEGWYALLPGETEFYDNFDESDANPNVAHRQNYLGFFSSEQDLLDEVYDELPLEQQSEQDVLAAHGIEVYKSKDVPGNWGFTGCDSDCYESEADSTIAALESVGVTRKVQKTEYLFYIEGLGRELWQAGESQKSAHKAVWDSLGSDERDRVVQIECIDQRLAANTYPERKLPETTKIRLTFDVVYTPNGTAVEELKENLESVARLAVNEGMLTGGTEAEVEDYQFEVVASPSVSQDVGAATLFWRELSESVETLTELADQHGPRTLADLMYLQNAILSGGFIDHYPDESDALEVLKALPSADRWLQFVKIEELENENDSPAPGK